MFCEMPSVYYAEVRKARKAHVCYECRGTIQPGESYNYHHGVWDGRGESFKVCDDCDTLRAEVDGKADSYEENTPFGYLHESIFDADRTDWAEKYIAIRRKRGADVPEWMTRKLQPKATP